MSVMVHAFKPLALSSLMAFFGIHHAAAESSIVWQHSIPFQPAAGIEFLPENQTRNFFAAWSFAVDPPQNQQALAVTFYYDEANSGFLRVSWKAGQSSTLLINNLNEGTALPNQRTLFLFPDEIRAGGILTVQSGSNKPGLLKARFIWLHPSTLWSNRITSPTLRLSDGSWFNPDYLPTQVPPLASDSARGELHRHVLADKPERLDNGLIFIVDLESVPHAARLEGDFSGLPMDQDIDIWINGQRVRSLPLNSPELDDPGWLESPGTPNARYAGWLSASALLPADILQKGENRIMLVSPVPEPLPSALKNLVFECLYDSSAIRTQPETSQRIEPILTKDLYTNQTQPLPWLLPELPEEFIRLPIPEYPAQ